MKEKCAKCGSLLNGRYVPINGKKYCTVACAKEATGYERDPNINNWIFDKENDRIIVKS